MSRKKQPIPIRRQRKTDWQSVAPIEDQFSDLSRQLAWEHAWDAVYAKACELMQAKTAQEAA
jgi:hypothetical protein